MKRNNLVLPVTQAWVILTFIFCISQARAQEGNPAGTDFNTWFISKTLRVDYLLAGDSRSEVAYFVQMKEEPNWGGPHKNLTDPFGYGTYRYSAYDSATKKLLFSRGFSTLFQEWKGTAEAKKIKRSWPMTAVMPFPKNTIRFVIEKRSYETNEFELLFDRFINPSDYFISREAIHPVRFTKIKDSGDPQNHVDVAFLAEGYTSMEMDKFRADAKRLCDYFMSVEPYAGNSGYFNFYAIESPSDESGVTIPGKDIFVNTNIHSSFYTPGKSAPPADYTGPENGLCIPNTSSAKRRITKERG